MRQLKWRVLPVLSPEVRGTLVTILSLTDVGTISWGEDGNIYMIRGGTWYQAEVTED